MAFNTALSKISVKVLWVKSHNSALSFDAISKLLPKCASKCEARDAWDSHILANCMRRLIMSSVRGGNASLIRTKAGRTGLKSFIRWVLDTPKIYINCYIVFSILYVDTHHPEVRKVNLVIRRTNSNFLVAHIANWYATEVECRIFVCLNWAVASIPAKNPNKCA